MPIGRGLRIPLALVALVCGLAHGQPTYPIGLDQSASGVVGADATAHVYLLEVPAGTAGFTASVRGAEGGADLAVFYGDDALRDDADPERNAVFAVANPRAGTYRIVVTNLLAEDLDYVLSVWSGCVARLELGSGVVAPGGSVVVRFVGAPGNARDWIGLFARGASDCQFVSWQYLGGAASGQRTFVAPSVVGAYEFRMFANDGYDRLAASPPFDVEVLVVPGTGPVGHGACETDGACRAP
jgi:hypothetical protein